MSPPSSRETGRFSSPRRVSGPGRTLRVWGKLWGPSPAPEPGGPSEDAAVGLSDQRRALVNRYTVDAETAASHGEGIATDMTAAHTELIPILPSRTTAAELPRERSDVGTIVALLIFSSALGLGLVSTADALSRSGHKHGGLPFWLGLLAIFLPVTARLASKWPTRNERVGLLMLLGLASFLVKVFRDPFRFLYTDEFVHQYNAVSILATHKLFSGNPILPATPAYPGLEAPTAALASLTGMSTFAAGLVVIAAARLIMMLALFLLYETVTGSGRVAGLAAALYAASPHYLFFVADFSYESLALPIAILALTATLRARPSAARGSRAWFAVALILIAGVVVTHHMTAYALIVTLLGVCVIPLPWVRQRLRRPWSILAAAVALTVGWLILVGRETVGYLSPVILGALRETIKTVQGEAQVRQLFGSTGGVSQGPPWERVVGFGSAALVALALPFGLRIVWQRFRYSPTAIVFSLAAVAYVGSLALRLVPSAWVVAARASEFLFIGTGFLLAIFALWVLERFPARGARVGLVAAAAVLLIGGVISTTPSSTRLAEPYRVSVRRGDVQPQAATVAQWASKVLGSGNRVAAGAADGRFLLVTGRQHVFVGTNPPVAQMLQAKALRPWQIALLRRLEIHYVVADSQPSGADDSNGYYFFRRQPDTPKGLPGKKFERAGADPIYDSGNIVVFDLASRRARNARRR